MFNALFAFDIYVSLRTGYYGDNGKLVIHRGKILLNYMRGWFFIDFITLVPFEFLLSKSLS